MRLIRRDPLRLRSGRLLAVVAAALMLPTAVEAVPSALTVGTTAGIGERPHASGLTSVADAAEPAQSSSGLRMLVNERGRISRSITAAASDSPAGGVLRPTKPAGADVRRAYLAYATTGFTGTRVTEPLLLDGQPVPISDETANSIGSYNYFADVTTIVERAMRDVPSGEVDLPIVEPDPSGTEGEILVVIYDDPSVTSDQTVSLMFGALSTTGDSYAVQLASPVKRSDPATHLEMSLGISYSYQSGAQQYSTVDVNGKRLTTSAGGEDDGAGANGSLITVGGDGDSLDNPADPMATPRDPRSDDELYDLRDFVADGDSTISITTSNPSNDDNVFLATFTMNPPVTRISTDGTFVQVALGDSYQSGEGAGNSVADTSDYLLKAYENGSNYPQQVGPQENSYTAAFGGNSCHRSLANYAKINRNLLDPGAHVVLVDVTCSGAQIEPGGKPPVVGTSGSSEVDPASQVRQALDRLASLGLTAADVDLVTVGMGGNDAKFGDIVAACLAPNLARRLLKAYPNSPGEIDFLANYFATCDNADNYLFKTGPAIDALAPKETWAQAKLLDAFPTARVLQLDYPDILPSKDNAPAWCGGIRKEDLDYAQQKVQKIDSIVDQTVAANGGRYQLVDVKGALGPNALCPATAEQTLANGFDEGRFDAELSRLLNLDGHGDAVARRKLDDVVAKYQAYKSCLATHYNPLGGDCDTGKSLDALKAAGLDLMSYLQTQQSLIEANLVGAPGSEPLDVRVDRSRGFFHPNANGFAVLACHVRAAWSGTGANGCLGATSPISDTVNGAGVQNAPIPSGAGIHIHIRLWGWQVDSTIHITLFSRPVDLGTATADANGVLDTTVVLPQAAAGAHTLVFTGDSAGGTSLQKRVRVQYDGRPRGGDSYSTYVCCFPAAKGADGAPDQIDILFHGDVLTTLTPNEDGGAFVELPVLDLLNAPGPLTFTARSRASGTTINIPVDPVPSVAGLWATATTPGALVVSGSRAVVTGRVHSNADITVNGSGASFSSGTEYATSLIAPGRGNVLPDARRVPAGGLPDVVDVAAYRPGGAAASAAGSAYHAIPASSCVNGTWRVAPGRVPAGVVYVPCAIALDGAGTVAATLVAEGRITTTGAGLVVRPGDPSAPALVSGAAGAAAVSLLGQGAQVLGAVQALGGEVRVEGAGARLRCGVVSRTISVTGADTRVDVDETCRRV